MSDRDEHIKVLSILLPHKKLLLSMTHLSMDLGEKEKGMLAG